MTPNDIHTHRAGYHSALNREASSSVGWRSWNPPPDSVQRVRDFVSLPNPSLKAQGWGEDVEDRKKDGKSQRWWMTPRKQHLPNTTGLMHTWTHRDWQQAQDLQRFKPDKISWLRREWTQNPTLNQEAMYLLGMENQFYSVEWHWGYQPYSRHAPYPE